MKHRHEHIHFEISRSIRLLLNLFKSVNSLFEAAFFCNTLTCTGHAHILFPHFGAMAERIDVTTHARAHPLFGMLDYLVRKSHTQSQQLEAVNTRLSKIENSINTITEVQKELKQLLKDYSDENFSIEKTPYQVTCLKYIF